MTTTAKIQQRIAESLKYELRKVLPELDPAVKDKTVETALATALAPHIKLLEKAIEIAALQGNPVTAASEVDQPGGQLENWGRLSKLGRARNAAIPGRYGVIIAAEPGHNLPVGALFVDNNTGFVYIAVSVQRHMDEDIDLVIVESVGVGSDVEATRGTVLTLQIEYEGIASEGTIDGVSRHPQPIESVEDYREEVLRSFAIIPRGGAIGDYVYWGLQVEGIHRVFPYIDSVYSGSVYIQGILTDESPVIGNLTLAMLEAVINTYKEHQPIGTGEITVDAVQQRDYTVNITDFNSLILTKAEAAERIKPLLKAYCQSKYPFVSGVDDPADRHDRILLPEIMVLIYNALAPEAGISGVELSAGGVQVFDEYLPQGQVPWYILQFDGVTYED